MHGSGAHLWGLISALVDLVGGSFCGDSLSLRGFNVLSISGYPLGVPEVVLWPFSLSNLLKVGAPGRHGRFGGSLERGCVSGEVHRNVLG